MEEFFINALQGVAASGPVAIVLLWRLWVSDKRIKGLEDRIDKLTDDHNKFMKSLAGVEE